MYKETDLANIRILTHGTGSVAAAVERGVTTLPTSVVSMSSLEEE